MSESVIRIPANQALINGTNNLIDIIIPGNSGVYDLSNTYISLLSRVSSDSPTAPPLITGETESGIYDIRVHMDHQLTDGNTCIYNNVATPIECLVQSCSMSSASKGGIEDIRRADILRGTLSVYKEDLDSRQAKALTTWSGACKSTPWVHGQHVELRGEGKVRSREVTHEMRFNLRDLFDAGQFEAWDSSVYGDTRIHLELNLGRVQLTQVQGSTDITWARAYQSRVLADGTTADVADFGYTTCSTNIPAVTGTATATKTLVMKTPYDSLADVPFWVGQDVTITPKNVRATGDAKTLLVAFPPQTVPATGIAEGATGDPGRAIISEIQFDKASGIVSLVFANDVLGVQSQVVPATNAGTLECDITGSDVAAGSQAIAYEACELVATMRSDVRMGQAPKEHQFSRFVFQGDQFTNTAGTQRTYQIPANCTAVVMAITNTGDNHSSFLGSAEVFSYRFSINGEAVTNRKVTYAAKAAALFKCKAGSALHYDLLQKTFLNMGQNARYESMLEGVFDQLVPVDQPGDLSALAAAGVDAQQGWSTKALSPKKSAFVLGVPIPMSQEPSQLLLELEGAFTGGAAINIYSYVMTSV